MLALFAAPVKQCVIINVSAHGSVKYLHRRREKRRRKILKLNERHQGTVVLRI